MMNDHPGGGLLPRSRELRERMIETQIVARGVRDRRVLDAIRRVPRELFVPSDHIDQAYDDCALPVGPGQTISQPYIVAYMTQQIDAAGVDTVLEIGTGTGYQAAILAQLARRLVTVELDAGLSAAAEDRLRRLGISNVSFHVGDGSEGWREAAPFGRILVTAGCPTVPAPLVEQLEEDGVLIAPVGDTDAQSLVRIYKRAGKVIESALIGCRFVKLIGHFGWSG